MPGWLRVATVLVLTALLILMATAADAVMLIEKPVTVTVAVPETIRGAQAVLLQLQQVTTPKSAPVTWRIFAELPSAGVQTSVDHPNFVGYVSMLANPS